MQRVNGKVNDTYQVEVCCIFYGPINIHRGQLRDRLVTPVEAHFKVVNYYDSNVVYDADIIQTKYVREGAIKIDKGGQLTSMNINGSVEYTANFNLVSIVYLSILRTHLIFMRSLETSKT